MADHEEEYFKRIELEKREKQHQKNADARTVEEKASLRELHFNKCGKCGTDMGTHRFRGVEIEICPACGAVLLDEGELQTLAGEDPSGVIASIAALFVRGKSA